ncbi:double-strand break repair helicase AddA [Sphingomonas sp.]|uniref:double-strand break repair helicase AddA n=1 Tax=Sphingomonas sp. TaxID=28214 RepID=UPI001EB0C8AD|nr:double-strand break repair helicase AddA [Sphingomonas sp.]MBX3593887.1 double-strand break repair helicase AddA [Sphingomonas sp.]
MAGTRRGALLPLTATQTDASAPDTHVWLAASAGTGKTQVLAARVWRLLLHGARPGAILCLTFTKAGASEMSARITGQLARWVRADRAEVFADLEALGEVADDAMIARARTLFADVLDAPGGLRIQTIHSFCQSLLASFPLEANLTPGFRALEPREEAVLRRAALADMLIEAEREGRRGVADAIGALSLRLGEEKAEAFLHECARRGDALDALPHGIQPWLRRALDLPTGDIPAEIARRCGDDVFDRAGLADLLAMNLAWGTARAGHRAAAIQAWIAMTPGDRAAGIGILHAELSKGNFAKGWVPPDPAYADIAEPIHAECAELAALQVRAAYADLLADGLEAGRTYARTYAEAKKRIGGVDFDDLIRATIRLLGQEGMGEWIRFKLDQETEHVLIDEAQDTNAEQWAIIDAIVDEYFAGAGTRGNRLRTLFTVGDYKQAIYGFQGTDPAIFRAMLDRYRARASVASELIGPDDPQPAPLNDLSLTHSFRSTRPILEFVDAAIASMPPPAMGALSDPEPHASEVKGPGSVTLWPPVVAGGSDADEEEWVAEPVREVARRIARQVREWIGTLPMRREGQTLSPGDVMILVKRRGELASLIVARLYAEGVPVAGVDRLRLNAPLAVQDLLAAVRFALQPEDDLNLATLLVSPLVGWTQDDLLAVAAHRREGLWRHVRDSVAAERLEPLYAILARADFSTPYQFLEWLLSGPIDARRRLLRRLGAEARDPIEELLNAALNFERVATPSLQRFLDWFDRGDVEIVRDAAQPQDAVRVMTAHGAKGLQAPLVILADATLNPGDARRDLLGWTPDGHDGGSIPVIRPRAGERHGALDDLIEETDRREMEEHWRLFYVAATRAEERLVITGALGSKDKGVPQPNSWYATAAAAFDRLGVAAEEGARSFVGTAPQDRVKVAARAAPASVPATPLPGWAHRPAPIEARPPRPLAPSAIGDDAVADPPPGPAMRAAAERGRLIHALLERLPAIEPSARADAAERWLAGPGGVSDSAIRHEIADAALGVLTDPRFDALFGSDALAEAPIAAVIAGGHVVSGTADRLLVTERRVQVIDFKTGRRAPATLDDVPVYHLRQMAAYVAALRVIFPDREVEAALLYTAGPALFDLPDALLDAHKPGLPIGEQSFASNA